LTVHGHYSNNGVPLRENVTRLRGKMKSFDQSSDCDVSEEFERLKE